MPSGKQPFTFVGDGAGAPTANRSWFTGKQLKYRANSFSN